MKKIPVLFIFLAIISTMQFSATAQQATAKATVDPVEIMIGEQSVITIEVIAPKGREVVFPVYDGEIVKGVEVLGMIQPDTVYAHDVMTLTQRYVVTSFDSALYHIPYMPLLDNTDTIRTNGFGLKVITPELSEMTLSYLEEIKDTPPDTIDMERLGAFDIKDIKEVPFIWKDYLMPILLVLLILILIAIFIAAVVLYNKKKKKGYFFTPKIPDPPHVIALNALNKLKDEKKWAQGYEKEYYTELTDILRKYIEDRFRVKTFEKTSDEILAAMNNFVEAESSQDSLTQILKLADLVKFAKYKPLTDENDLSLVNSVLFVNQTKVELPKTEINENGDNNTGNNIDGSSSNRVTKQGLDDDNEPIDWTVPEDQKLFDDDNKPIKGRI